MNKDTTTHYPQFVMGASAGDRWHITKNPDGNDVLRDPDVRIVELPLKRDKDILADRLFQEGLLRRCEVLMHSPFEIGQYVPIANVSQEIPLVKFYLFTEFCGLLGAKRVHLEQIQRLSSEGRTEITLDFSERAATGVTDTFMNRFSSEISLVTEFHGGEPDLQMAEKLLANARLQGDVTFTSLLRQRRAKNMIVKMKQTLNLMTEAKRGLERFGRIHFPQKLGDINSALNGSQDEIKEYILTATVEF